MLSEHLAHASGLPTVNPRPTEGIPGRGYIRDGQLSAGEPIDKSECERVPAYSVATPKLIQLASLPAEVAYNLPDKFKIPLRMEIYLALMYHRPYFWARRKIAIALPTGTLYAAYAGWRFEPSAFIKS